MVRTNLALPRLAALTAALLAPFAVPAVASATGTVTSSSGVMTVTSGNGDADFTGIISGNTIGGVPHLAAVNNNPLTGVQIGITAGTGCVASGIFAECPKPPITSIIINSGDLNDRLTSNQNATTFNAGTGDDWIVAEAGSPLLATYNGGSGVDTVSYNSGPYAIAASINGTRDDGYYSGQGNIATDVERAIGGYGNDTMSGASASRSTLMGQGGNDSLTAGSFGSNLYGGKGNDTLTGGNGADSLTDFVGTDTMIGGAGNDTFYAEDLDNADQITCGSGYDVAFVDGPGEISDWGSTTSCEQVVYN